MESSPKYSLIILVTTEDDVLKADTLAKQMLELKLAACVHIREIKSLYWWNDKLQESNEFQLIFKTSYELLHDLSEAIKSNHSYKIPEIIFWEVNSSDEYKKWLEGSLSYN